MSGSGKKLRAVLLAFVMVTSMVVIGIGGLAGTAAANSATANIDNTGNAGNPPDVPGGNSGVSQQVFADANADTLSINTLTDPGSSGSVQHAVKIDISDLEDAGADLSNANVDLSNSKVDIDESGAGSASIDFANVDGNEIQLVVGYNGDDATDDDVGVDIQLALSGLDTGNVNTASGLSYTVRVDDTNSGDFGSGFTTDAISSTNEFGIASVIAEDLDTGTTVTETSLSAALDELNGNDQLTGSNDIEITLIDGTYSPGGVNTIDDDGGEVNRIVAANGATPVINSDNDPTFTVNGDTVFEGITFDQADSNNEALQVADGADLTLTDTVFQNPGTGDKDYLQIIDDSGTIDINNATFDGNGENNFDGIVINDDDGGADVTITESNFTDLKIGIDASTDLTGTSGVLNSFSVTDSQLTNNNFHVNDNNDNTNVNLDSIFSANSFDQFAITRNENGNIANGNTKHAIYGDAQQVIDEGSANLDQAEHTTIISSGDHTWDTAVALSGNDDVTLRGANSADVANVTVDITAGTRAIDLNGNDASGLTVSDITFEVEGKTLIEDNNGGSTQTDLNVNDNRFVEVGNTRVIDFEDTNDVTVQGGSISDNVFEPTGSSSDYRAATINSISEDGSATTITVNNNVINGSGTNNALSVAGLTESGGNEITLQISENTIRKTGSGDAINLAGLDTSDAVDVRVTRNTISASDASTADGIVVVTSGEATTSIANNDISQFDDANGATAIDSTGFTAAGLTIESNILDTNAEQVNFNNANQDVENIRSNNNFVTRVEALTQEDGDLINPEIHGTITAGLAEAGSSGQFVAVFDGTYAENGLSFSNDDVTLAAASGASPTVTPVSGDTTEVFDLTTQDGTTVRGLTIDSSDQNVGTDDVVVDSSGTDENKEVTLENNVFTGSDDRTAIDYDADATQDGLKVTQNTISGYATGVFVNGNSDLGDAEIVRNQISDSGIGVDIQSASTESTVVNFNNIVSNDVGIETDDTEAQTAVANWFGAASGPSGDAFNGEGDQIAGSQASNTRAAPWLTEPVTNLPTDRFVVVPDPRGVPADGVAGAEIAVAVLNATKAADTDDSSTRVLADSPDPISGAGQIGAGGGGTGTAASAVDPLISTGGITSNVPGDFTLTARDSDGNVQRGSAVQTYQGSPGSVQVTSERGTLTADDSTTVNATLQVVDENGNPVNKAGDSVTFLIDGASNAGVTRVTEETTTDANGQARLEISADTEDVDLEVTGVYDPQGFSDSVNITTTLERLDVQVSPDTVTAENETDLTVNVSSTASGSGVENAEVALSGPGVDQSVFTDANGQATATVNASSAGTIDVNVSANGFEETTSTITVEEAGPPTATVTFNDQSVQNGSTTVNVASATFNGSEAFNIVVHQATDDNEDGTIQASEIGTKIGESEELEAGTSTNIPVDISKQVADDDNVSQLTENQTLVAMLHTTNTSDDDNIVHTAPITRDGTPVFDQAEITIEDEQTVNVGGEDVPVEFTTTENGETTVTSDDAVSAVRAFINDEPGVDSDTAVSVIRAFINSNQ